MSATVAHLYEEALHLSDDSRVELAERLIESAQPSLEILAEQIKVATERMKALEAGQSVEIPGQEAHDLVRRSIPSKS